jgi:hypothetical protein
LRQTDFKPDKRGTKRSPPTVVESPLPLRRLKRLTLRLGCDGGHGLLFLYYRPCERGPQSLIAIADPLIVLHSGAEYGNAIPLPSNGQIHRQIDLAPEHPSTAFTGFYPGAFSHDLDSKFLRFKDERHARTSGIL